MKKSLRIPYRVTFSVATLALCSLGVPLAHGVSKADTPTNYHLVRTIHVSGSDGWDYLFDDAAAQRLYISHGSHVPVINTETGQVAGDIPDTSGVHGVAIDPKSGRGFTSNGRTNTVTIFDTKTLQKIGEVPVGQGTDAIVFEPVTERVFTFNGRSATATAIDAATGTVVGTVTLPGRPEYPVADGKGHIFDNITDEAEIADINAKTLAVEHTWSIAPGDRASGLAMDIKGRRLFSVCDNQKLIVMDADTGKVVASPTIGNGPDACSYDPENHLVFCPAGEDGTITIFKQVTPDQYVQVQTLTTQTGARTMTIDTKTHHIFTVTATEAPASASQDGPPNGGPPGGGPDNGPPGGPNGGPPAGGPNNGPPGGPDGGPPGGGPGNGPRRGGWRPHGFAPNSFVVLEYAP